MPAGTKGGEPVPLADQRGLNRPVLLRPPGELGRGERSTFPELGRELAQPAHGRAVVFDRCDDARVLLADPPVELDSVDRLLEAAGAGYEGEDVGLVGGVDLDCPLGESPLSDPQLAVQEDELRSLLSESALKPTKAVSRSVESTQKRTQLTDKHADPSLDGVDPRSVL